MKTKRIVIMFGLLLAALPGVGSIFQFDARVHVFGGIAPHTSIHAQFVASNGLKYDSNNYIFANLANTGGSLALINSQGFPLDSSGNLLIDCALNCGSGTVPASNCGDSTHALGWNGTAYTCQAITATAAAGGSTTQLQYNNATALGGISQFTTNGTTTITGSATSVFDLHAAGTGGLLLPGALATGIVKVTTATGALTILTAPAGAIVGTTDAQALTNKDLTGAGNTFPTFNQTTTGSAATWTTARNLAGNSVNGSADVAFANKFVVQGTVDAGLSAAQFLGALGTGIVKNTTTTGVLSIAVAGDFPTLNQNTTGTASSATNFSGSLAGDVTGPQGTTVVAKINGNSVTTGAANNQVLVCTSANTCVWKTLPDCVSSSNALNFTAATNVFSCLSITTLSNPMTTLGDVLYGGASGAVTRLAGPTATNSVPQYLQETPAAGAAVAPVWAPAGVPTNAQTGTTYTVAATDRASYVTFSNAGAIAVTLPQAGTTGFASNFVTVGCDIGAGTATITPTTSTISYTTGTAFTSAAATMTLATGECAWIYSDNTNYSAIKRAGGGGSGTVTSVATTSPIAGGTITGTGTITCATCVTSAAALTNNQLVFGAGSQASAVGDLTGDVTTSGGKATTIAANAVTLAKMATQANATLLSNVSGGSAVPSANALPVTANALIKTSNTNGALAASLTTDDGTTSTYTGTGGTKSPAFTATGTTAGFADYPQGTTSAAVAPCNVATSICEQAPTAVTSYLVVKPGAAGTGVRVGVNSSSVITENFSSAFGAVTQSAKTAAVTTFTVCAATANTACGQAGQYRLTYNVWGSGTACSSVTAGSVVLNFTWTDANAVTHTTINAPMWDQKTSAMTAGQTNFNTALGTEGGSGSFIVSTNGTIIQAATTYTACTTGTGTYNVKITTEQLQ